jgi:hypothetical protein
MIGEKRMRKGRLFLGFRNPSAIESVEMSVEVVARVPIPPAPMDTFKAKKYEQLGDKLFAEKKFDAAAKAYTSALQIDSTRNNLFAQLFLVNMAAGNWSLFQEPLVNVLDRFQKKQIDTKSLRQLRDRLNQLSVKAEDSTYKQLILQELDQVLPY